MIVILATLSGCAGKTEQVGSSNPVPEAVENPAQNDSGTDINVSLGQNGENMPLPESFPKDVLPLTEDANIINVNDNGEGNSIGIIFKTDMSFEESITYYQNIMKDGTMMMENKKADSYIFMGSKDKYGISISISKYDGDKVSILLDVALMK